jgi:hypothetical protein
MLELMNSFNLCYSCSLKKSVESFQSPEGLVNCQLSIVNYPLELVRLQSEAAQELSIVNYEL